VGATTGSCDLLVGSAPPLDEARVTKAGRDRRADRRLMRRLYPSLQGFLNHTIGESFTIQDAKINQGVLSVSVFKILPGTIDFPIRVEFGPPTGPLFQGESGVAWDGENFFGQRSGS
jgi:hypothetical protein